MKIISPFKFRERQLLMGGGGAGKTSAALSQIQASRLPGHVIENDYSFAWSRALDTDFDGMQDQVEVIEVMPDWDTFIDGLEAVVKEHQDDKERWLVIDSVSPTWEWVQSWYSNLANGNSLSRHMAELRRDADSTKDYQAALADTMNWPAVKSEYNRLWKAIMTWKGHLILTAEAKSIKGERDSDLVRLYGPVGFKPVGEARLHHVTSTTLFLEHATKGWAFTSIKDRNRAEVERKVVDSLEDGGFSTSYLREVAGWQLARKAKVVA